MFILRFCSLNPEYEKIIGKSINPAPDGTGTPLKNISEVFFSSLSELLNLANLKHAQIIKTKHRIHPNFGRVFNL